jgi:hypothetical protein
MKTAVSRLAMSAASVAVLVNGWEQAGAAPAAPDLLPPVAGRLNLYEDVGAGGGQFVTDAGDTRDTNLHNDFYDNGHSVGDETSSVWNRTSQWAVLFEDDGYGGQRLCVAPGKSHADIRLIGNFGDKISSYQLWTTLPNGIGCTWTVK